MRTYRSLGLTYGSVEMSTQRAIQVRFMGYYPVGFSYL